jgi:hypothetical protein
MLRRLHPELGINKELPEGIAVSAACGAADTAPDDRAKIDRR